MTDRMKKYLVIQKKAGIAFFEENDTEYEQLSDECIKLRNEMSLEEVENMKAHVTAREFYYSFKPLIEVKKGKV